MKLSSAKLPGILVLTAATLALGCDDKKKAAAPRPPAAKSQAEAYAETEASIKAELAGTWEAVQGDPKTPGAFYSTMTLELRPDSTFTYSIVMPDLKTPGKTTTKKAAGPWDYKNEAFTATLERALEGGEIPPAQRVMSGQVASAEKEGYSIIIRPDGPTFTRKAK
jgi:hypothetical protein